MANTNKEFGIYLDLDGVLVDLEAAVLQLAGKDPATVTKRDYTLDNILPEGTSFWGLLQDAGLREQFANLGWLPYGKRVLEVCESIGPVTIGTSAGHLSEQGIRRGKADWLAREIPHLPVRYERKKGTLPGDGHVLIDDLERNITAFRNSGRMAIQFPRLFSPNGPEWISEWVEEVLPRELELAKYWAEGQYRYETRTRENRMGR
jgi:hypothetical protein